VVIEDRVRETEDGAIDIGHDGVMARPPVAESIPPYRESVGEDVGVEIAVQVGAPVVTPPAVGMKGGHRLGIG
jgi:hypothetical protein